MKPGSLAIGQPGKKTVERAFDPGTYVWRGQVNVTKLRHPECIPLTNRMISELRDVGSASDAATMYFRGAESRLPPTTRTALEEWVALVTSPKAEAERKAKRRAAAGLTNPDGSKKVRGKFKPKGPPASWKSMSREEMMEKSASALKNFLKTYTYEKVPKSLTKSKLVDLILELLREE
uniref:Uncharacterized protein n=1 Tax=Grammatophora oceanica TaxID=210454 RepID=A0A7S1VSR0_9STRA|eukprot:CAMPEP_0194062688 /NCGR_PEP_ID=MMETSP0009_2-20130614/78222_1 /TAXON_ID=210454 /ORGANISM="Grammatophora oceanica, Strain CCMP 410" /LENGTH=177 /DNA_ID=CAMNT_0038714515 /DNA_START=41 /DNA_END=574 /DNA_ORIENTATION=-